MKVMTILGTRPEIIRLCRVMAKLDTLCDHTVIHTGQNHDEKLSDIFFNELHIRPPDCYLGVRGGNVGQQISGIMNATAGVIAAEKPERVLILGDTDSGLSALVAKRLGARVYHLEAGNRCYDDRVPEEINRRVIDHSSDVLMPYTERSRANLIREGFPSDSIFVIGNPIYEVMRYYEEDISRSDVFARLNLERGRYFLTTMHRAENVDVPERLASLLKGMELIQQEFSVPVICSVHPRTRRRMEEYRVITHNTQIHFHEPFGFFDFLALERGALCVLSDSGTVQEECCISNIGNVTIRDVTERPETLECGSNILSGADPHRILASLKTVLECKQTWSCPPEYLRDNVSSTVVKIVLGHRDERRCV